MLSRFERIVVGLDLDPATCQPTNGSGAAVEVAHWLAESAKSQVTLLHSLAQQEYFDPLLNELVAVCGSVTPEGRATISALVARFRNSDIPCETVDSTERPSLAIAREVERQAADLVLLGKHDGHEADASRIGEIALRVLRESTTPVWIVAPGRSYKPRVIVAATDLTAASDEAVACAARVASLTEAELHIVHVHPPALHTRPGSAQERERRMREAMLRALTSEERESARLHIRENSPAQGVLEMVEELEPDLVVFGALAHKRDKAGVVGSTAERLIGRLETSLLVIRPA